jgi:hypothetical protein
MIEAKNIEKILADQGFIISSVKGDSMLPMLDETKDAVRIVPMSEPLKKYDIPLYRRPGGQLVLHRIIEVKKNHYITCGDNRRELEKVPQRWVVGVLEGFFKDGEYISVTDKKYAEYVKERCASIKDREITAMRDANEKERSLVKKLFPGFYTMVRLYPSLERIPLLLPAAWIHRLIKTAFVRGKK